MWTLKYFLADAAKHKSRVHQLDFIGAFFQAKDKNRVFVKLDMRYADYFPEYSQYFGRALNLLKSMYGMTNSGKVFADELTEWLIEEGFMPSQCQMFIYYKYAPDESKIVVLSYVDDCVYWYTNEVIVYWIVMKNKSSELTRLDLVGIRLNQFEMFEERFNLLSR